VGAKREPKQRWKYFVFTPCGADRAAQSIRYGDDGFIHLCLGTYNRDLLYEYAVYDT
jgi:hypothetical protein